MLGSARDSVGALASVYDGSPNITLRKLLVLLPSDVRLRIAGLGELHGAGADATQQVVDELKLSNASQLFSTPLYVMLLARYLHTCALSFFYLQGSLYSRLTLACRPIYSFHSHLSTCCCQPGT